MTRSLFSSCIAIGAIAVAGCSGEATPSVSYFSLAPGESVELEIVTDEPKRAGFSVKFGTPSWEAADNCPEKEVSPDFSIPICGELKQIVPEGTYGGSAAAQYGAGVDFQPENGRIRLKMTNHARQRMEFEVEVKDPPD